MNERRNERRIKAPHPTLLQYCKLEHTHLRFMDPYPYLLLQYSTWCMFHRTVVLYCTVLYCTSLGTLWCGHDSMTIQESIDPAALTMQLTNQLIVGTVVL